MDNCPAGLLEYTKVQEAIKKRQELGPVYRASGYAVKGMMACCTHLVDAGRNPTTKEMMQVPLLEARSEERRVGKECRSRWSPDH
mgnify:CR=1 FL=1